MNRSEGVQPAPGACDRVHEDPRCRCYTDRPHTCGAGYCRDCEGS